ncbi:hypothetical protein [Lancefieldella sp. Marseille-Q7238]|uniref:hypothetical protein n=1 Tax=Lancefieldella sp. Marseille-Q7238 TaxID=3022127 RepID=UPI0024A9D0C2|nr:hypothetical protein [Lancefieldella sp. Marseille-Q7238]
MKTPKKGISCDKSPKNAMSCEVFLSQLWHFFGNVSGTVKIQPAYRKYSQSLDKRARKSMRKQQEAREKVSLLVKQTASTLNACSLFENPR